MDSSLRTLIWQRAGRKCEYCHISQDHDTQSLCIDHVIAKKHHGSTTEDNLALACFSCNTSKGTNIASIDQVTNGLTRLFHPRRDKWSDHFAWEGAGLLALTDIGRVTVHILSINAEDRIELRAALLAEGIIL